jgi:hypothetical protein
MDKAAACGIRTCTHFCAISLWIVSQKFIVSIYVYDFCFFCAGVIGGVHSMLVPLIVRLMAGHKTA